MPAAETEPVRKNLYVAAAVVAASTFFGACGVVDRITVQVVFAGLGASLAQFAVIAFGVERARDKAWSPATVSELVDAEHVIGQVAAEPPPTQ